MREADAAGYFGDLDGAFLAAAVASFDGGAAGWHLVPGQGFQFGQELRRDVGRAARCPFGSVSAQPKPGVRLSPHPAFQWVLLRSGRVDLGVAFGADDQRFRPSLPHGGDPVRCPG